ncbi:GNAT superfamily N-acetyltransferase [Crossiella equi]|uniref:GNAT superfamily N-acetyltransferase n=1 Tax=Crossiella equi TaxID=130796 RepID=A0ABS5AQI2_9PSEU|nr:GNAT family N-acetyltransferase [Crossiella equi]MBP2478828.1 GNAT superfamily N-acetyltransferase [Crossiella equi]
MHEELLDHTGRVLARYRLSTRMGLPCAADLVAVDAEPTEVVEVLLERCAGWVFSGPPEIALAAKAKGGTLVRHGHSLSYDLSGPVDPAWREPELPAGLRVTPVDLPVARVYPALRRAYPPGHPDHVLDPEAHRHDLDDLLSGRWRGPLLRCGGLVLDGEDVVAGVVASTGIGVPPLGGPWIAQVFRDPDPAYRGLGAALLRRTVAQAAADGLPAIGLAVTEGNPARTLYERLGFRHVEESMTVLMPA